jgi:cytochrome b561/polyisoprenoid-binding protein YceI
MISNSRYHYLSQILHWLIAGLIVVQFALANLAESAADKGSAVRELALLANHKSVGITVLALVIVRLIWRHRTPPPQLPATMQQWQLLASRISHWMLYGLIILLPLSGWLMSSASAYSVSWFNFIQLPDFVAPDPGKKAIFQQLHEFMATTLFIVAVVHVFAALKHHLIDKDGVLTRMTSTAGIGLFAIVAGLGIWSLGSVGPGSGEIDLTAPVNPDEAIVDTAISLAVGSSKLSQWQIDYADSFIHFAGDQAGASFNGNWKNWSGILFFDEQALQDGLFDVTITTAEVDTQDTDRDMTLADPEWFDVMNFPEASYRSNKFTRTGVGHFAAEGVLTIKDTATRVVFNFTIETNGAHRVLVGRAELSRTTLGIGTGEWADTSWVSDEVLVDVRVAATISD